MKMRVYNSFHKFTYNWECELMVTLNNILQIIIYFPCVCVYIYIYIYIDFIDMKPKYRACYNYMIEFNWRT